MKRQLKYILAGYSSYTAGSEPETAKALSRHYSLKNVKKAFNSDRSGLYLMILDYNGEKINQDIAQRIVEGE